MPFFLNPRWWGLFTLGIATHQAVIALVRYSQAYPHWPRTAWLTLGVFHALITQGVAFWLADGEAAISGIGILWGAACLASAVAIFAVSEKNLQMPDDLNVRWWKQATTAVIASLGGFILQTK